MTVAEWCLFATVMLYLLTIAPVKWIGSRRYNNSKPRDPAFYHDPLRARALGAHQNGIEAFPFFAAAVLLAEFRAAPQNLINELAVLFLIVRIAYVLTYLGDRPRLRSILWNIGFAINIAIFFLPMIRRFCRCRTDFDLQVARFSSSPRSEAPTPCLLLRRTLFNDFCTTPLPIVMDPRVRGTPALLSARIHQIYLRIPATQSARGVHSVSPQR